MGSGARARANGRWARVILTCVVLASGACGSDVDTATLATAPTATHLLLVNPASADLDRYAIVGVAVDSVNNATFLYEQ